MAKLARQDYGYRSQGKDLPQLRFKLLMNIIGVLAQQKAEEAENMSKRSQNSQNELGQEATATLIPQNAPSVKNVTCAKLSCTLIHMVTGDPTYRDKTCTTDEVSEFQAAPATKQHQHKSVSRATVNYTDLTNVTADMRDAAVRFQVLYRASSRFCHVLAQNLAQRNSVRFGMSLPNSLAAAGSCCNSRNSVPVHHRSCILRESRLLVGWHCHQVSSYLLHCQPALHEAPGHAASTQLPTLSQYSLVPPHCP